MEKFISHFDISPQGNYCDGHLLLEDGTIIAAFDGVKEKFNQKGISTIVEDTNLTEFLELNNWNHASSYKASRIFMLDKQNTYKSLKYYIDIHRDSVEKSLSTTTINDMYFMTEDIIKAMLETGITSAFETYIMPPITVSTAISTTARIFLSLTDFIEITNIIYSTNLRSLYIYMQTRYFKLLHRGVI